MVIILNGSTTSWEEDVQNLNVNLSNKLNWLLFSLYHSYNLRYYVISNENIHFLCNRYKDNIKSGKILTAAGGGDQPLSFIANGARQIDMFDINKLAYYIFALKKGAIITLDELSYLELIFSLSKKLGDKQVNFNLMEKAISAIEEEDAKNFWLYIIRNFSSKQIRKLSREDYRRKTWSEDHVLGEQIKFYKYLRDRLGVVPINFHLADLKNLKPEDSNYDLIYLSNIFDCIDNDDLISSIIDQLIPLLRDDGVLLEYSIENECVHPIKKILLR